MALGRAELALMQELAERMGLAVQEEILALTASLPTIEHLERPAYLDRLRTLREESRELYFAVWALALVAEHALQIGLGVVLLAAVHPLLPLLLGAAVLPSLLVRGRAAARIDAATSSTAETARLELSLSETATSAGAAKDLRLGGAGEVLDAMAGRHWDAVSDELGRARLRAGLLTFAGSATFLAGYVAALAHAAWLAGRGQATAGDVVLVATVGVQFVTQAARLAFHLGSAAAGRHAATRLAWLRAYAAARHQDRGAAAPPPVLRGGITLAGLSFTYPGTSREVLHDLDLHLPAGATVALVGTHGSGKTTLVKLLCGLHRPSRGTILVDGRPLGDLAQDAWQARVGAVFQDHVRFELTAGETVGVGDLPKLRDPAAVAGGAGTSRRRPGGRRAASGTGDRAGGDVRARCTALRRAVAAAGPGSRVDADGAVAAGAGRADRRAGRTGRERGLRALRRGGQGPSGSRHVADHAPLPHRADGGPDRRPRRRPDRAVRHPRPAQPDPGAVRRSPDMTNARPREGARVPLSGRGT
ncbi:hypothetical protein GCM10020001_086220 [Nonomuraea salmonea]